MSTRINLHAPQSRGGGRHRIRTDTDRHGRITAVCHEANGLTAPQHQQKPRAELPHSTSTTANRQYEYHSTGLEDNRQQKG